ncbi:MAG: hypothetical protein U0X91_25040 [Spirosomataceae bacterium]
MKQKTHYRTIVISEIHRGARSSDSQVIKQKVKAAVNDGFDFEEKLTELVRSRQCDSRICGYIHRPALRFVDGFFFMDSGDWMESLSALVEGDDRNWRLVYYNEVQMGQSDEPIILEFFGVKERAAS